MRLRFTDTAIRAIAKRQQRERQEHGLRAILEDIMLDVMYEIPSQKDITECLINEDTIIKKKNPSFYTKNRQSQHSCIRSAKFLFLLSCFSPA